jgi:hypothetical protein
MMSIATAAAPDQVFPIWTVCLLGFFDELFDDTGGVPSCHRARHFRDCSDPPDSFCEITKENRNGIIGKFVPEAKSRSAQTLMDAHFL